MPLSRRNAGLGPDPTLYEGTPAHLRPVLWSWILERWRENTAAREELLCRLHLALLDDVPDGEQIEYLTEDQVLDIIDGILRWWPAKQLDDRDRRSWGDKAATTEPGPRSNLQELLYAGGSAWRISTDGRALERRVDDTVTAAADTAVQTAGGMAGEHLATAWRAAYGRNPDPDKSYAEAVKAVEALACPLVLPNKATQGNAILSNVIGDLSSTGATKWELLLTDTQDSPASVEPVVTMMRLLMQGHRSRHSGGPNTRRQTPAEAEAAVHLAATLVQWLSAGVLRRKP